MTTHHLTPRAIALGLAIYLLFSLSDSINRLLMLGGIPQQQVLMWVLLVGLIPPCLLITYEHGWKKLWPQRPGLVALRVGFACVELFLAFYAFRHLSLAESYALFFTMPLWVALLAALLLGEHLHRRQIIAIIIGFTGVLIANYRPEGLSALGLGQLAGLGAALLAALGLIIMRRIGKSENGTNVLLFLFGGLALFNALTLGEPVALNQQQLGLILLAGLVMATGHCCYVIALRHTPAPLLAPLQYSQVLWALVLGALIFGENVQPAVLTGLALIVAGGWLLVKKPVS